MYQYDTDSLFLSPSDDVQRDTVVEFFCDGLLEIKLC